MNPAEQIAADMRAIPESAIKEIRPKLREAGEAMAADARARAAWSRRIPPTIKVRVSFRMDRESVTIVAGGKEAPHARPYEGITGKGFFRHPVFADAKHKVRTQWKWVSQQTRPFLLPAAQAMEGQTTAAILTALTAAARTAGFKE